VMEVVALLAGETHSDDPACASPVITRLAIWLNDTAGDKLRNELLRDLPWRIVGTRVSEEIERQRAFMASDWAVRFVCPIMFRRAGLEKEASDLEALPVIDNAAAAYAANAAAYAAADAAYAANAAARAAADAAANAAYAAYAAANAAARAASDAAADAAYAANAAACAARAAADAAADDLERIMRSCAELLDRIIRLTEPQERVVGAAVVRLGA